MSKIALVTGITGQDGSYLAELLLKKKYIVHGLVRSNYKKKNKFNWRIKKIENKLVLHKVNINRTKKIEKILIQIKPNEIYHLAAQSYVDYFKKAKVNTMNINYTFTKLLLKLIKKNNLQTKFFFAGSSEMYGMNKGAKINERTKFNPKSTYGLSKLASFRLIKKLRSSYNLHASTGILFNHESPKKDKSFVLRKISSSVAKIKKGQQKKIFLGDIKSLRDWGTRKIL